MMARHKFKREHKIRFYKLSIGKGAELGNVDSTSLMPFDFQANSAMTSKVPSEIKMRHFMTHKAQVKMFRICHIHNSLSKQGILGIY
jgi:hypothetical protein